MFEIVVEKLVKVIGSDIFIPSGSIGDSERLSPLALVERKASRWWFGKNSYYSTEFTLENVVEGRGLNVSILNQLF